MVFVLLKPRNNTGKYIRKNKTYNLSNTDRSKKCINDIDGMIFNSRKQMARYYNVSSSNINKCSKIKLRYMD